MECGNLISYDDGAVLTDTLICGVLTEILATLPTTENYRYCVRVDQDGDIVVTLDPKIVVTTLDGG